MAFNQMDIQKEGYIDHLNSKKKDRKNIKYGFSWGTFKQVK